MVAANLRIWALSCDVWRSVRYETSWRMNSTVTSNLAALKRTVSIPLPQAARSDLQLGPYGHCQWF